MEGSTNVQQMIIEERPVPKEKQRESWSNQCEYFVTSLCLAVGLGNVWRFPYVCYQNGGGTFLVPYVIMLFFVGIPSLFFEQSLGQYARIGANKIFGRMVPLFKGLGYGIVSIACVGEMYYAVICAWSFFYMFAGFQTELPWNNCADGQEWHTPNCYSRDLAKSCRQEQYDKNSTNLAWTWYNGTCVEMETYCVKHNYTGGYDNGTNITHVNFSCTDDYNANSTDIKYVTQEHAITPAEDYFNGYVLGFTKGMSGETHSWGDYGTIRWELVLCMLLVWIVELLVLFKGLKVYGKIAYFMTFLPYLVLTAFLAYIGTKEGAYEGIQFFLQPQWEKLWEIDVWNKAASQILLSLSIGYGAQITLSSYNKFKNNTMRDSFLICLVNSATSIFAGFVVFAIVGFLAKETETKIENVVNDGIILTFVTYPSAMAHMDFPQLWSFLFFFMMINLSISSACGGIQTMAAFITDEWPKLREKRMLVFTCLSIVLFFCGIPLCTEGGMLLFTLFDYRCTSSLLFVLFLEIVVVAGFYGIQRFIDNIQEMGMTYGLSRPVGFMRLILIILIGIITPGAILVLCVIAWYGREPISYAGKNFPPVAEGFGWFLELVPLLFLTVMPIFEVRKLMKNNLTMKEIWSRLINPTNSWHETERIEKHVDDPETNPLTGG